MTSASSSGFATPDCRETLANARAITAALRARLTARMAGSNSGARPTARAIANSNDSMAGLSAEQVEREHHEAHHHHHLGGEAGRRRAQARLHGFDRLCPPGRAHGSKVVPSEAAPQAQKSRSHGGMSAVAIMVVVGDCAGLATAPSSGDVDAGGVGNAFSGHGERLRLLLAKPERFGG